MIQTVDKKQAVARAALQYIPENTILGIGSGTTMNIFIDFLPEIKHKIHSAIPSSAITAQRLTANHIPLTTLNHVSKIDLYIDSADFFNHHGQLIKGQGGALTQEKILAAASKQFLCIVDNTKQVSAFNNCPIAVEVLPMARSFVAREILKLGGTPVYRSNYITDNGNIILDVYYPSVPTPIQLETDLNQIPGVIENGLFTQYTPDRLLIGTHETVEAVSLNLPKSS